MATPAAGLGNRPILPSDFKIEQQKSMQAPVVKANIEPPSQPVRSSVKGALQAGKNPPHAAAQQVSATASTVLQTPKAPLPSPSGTRVPPPVPVRRESLLPQNNGFNLQLSTLTAKGAPKAAANDPKVQKIAEAQQTETSVKHQKLPSLPVRRELEPQNNVHRTQPATTNRDATKVAFNKDSQPAKDAPTKNVNLPFNEAELTIRRKVFQASTIKLLEMMDLACVKDSDNIPSSEIWKGGFETDNVHALTEINLNVINKIIPKDSEIKNLEKNDCANLLYLFILNNLAREFLKHEEILSTLIISFERSFGSPITFATFYKSKILMGIAYKLTKDLLDNKPHIVAKKHLWTTPIYSI
jgi:hypothetical protein